MDSAKKLPGVPDLLRDLKDILYRERFEALLVFDIDHLRQINQSQGEEAGDRVLDTIADYIAANEWNGFRIGGDEFAVIFETDDPRARKLTSSLPALIAGQTGIHATISGGGVKTPGQEYGLQPQMAEIVFSTAQRVLTRVKQAGRERLIWLADDAVVDDVDLTDLSLKFFREVARFNAALAKQMALESRTDFLTGLHNRRGFEEVFQRMVLRAQRNEQPLALYYMDSDSLKIINDSKGHDAGDRFIVDLSRVLNDMLRGSDLLSRWAGDEFAAVIGNASQKRALEIARRLNGAIAERTEGTMSIGIYHGVPESAEEALKKADDALYQVKARGKNDIQLAE
ncbi:MAG: diguanylate cyclase [Candidatus Latescibacteria bacterium]|nr:diguanylate cyclase [Candidatus Latescibacterota bacterium]